MTQSALDNTSKELREVPISDVEIWDEANTRHVEIAEGIDELAASIRQIGLLQPPLVQEENGKYNLISGQRRLLAVRQLGWKTIPVLVLKNPLDLDRAKLASIAENIQRLPVSPSDLSNACEFLMKKLGSDVEAAKALGISITTFRKYLGYKGVPEEIKSFVNDNKISVSDALRLAETVPSISKAVELAKTMAKLTKPSKDRFFVAIANDPSAPVPVIKKKAETLRIKRTLKIHLPDVYAQAIGKASIFEDREPEEIGLSAIIEWLEKSGYLSGLR
jgi:ParB family chromosome partitioning protein